MTTHESCGLAGTLSGVLLLAACASPPTASPDPASIRQHSDSFFQKLRQEEAQRKPAEGPQDKKETGPSQLSPPAAQVPDTPPQPQPSEDLSLTATGHGDLTQGPLICQRVADTAARAELAKLIRVTIKEHAIDRVRERTGRPFEQDIEVVREELVNELLQNVQIVDRRMDRSAGTCSSTAVMRRSTLIPLSPPSPLPIPLP